MTPSTANGHGVPFISIAYEPEGGQDSVLDLVLAVRPDWAAHRSTVEVVRCKDGITNTLLKVLNRRPGLSAAAVDDDAILLRAYGHGTDVLIDRHREAQNHELLMKHGLAPELLARFKNGMLYRYIRGDVTSPADLREPRIYRAVARRLAQWHATVPCLPSKPATNGHHAGSNVTNGVNGGSHETGVVNGSVDGSAENGGPKRTTPNLWTVMEKWIRALPVQDEAERARQALLDSELAKLIVRLGERPGLGEKGLVFAHCDLLSGNVIILPKKEGIDGGSDDTVSVSFIDYEYATPSPAAFDIANHFAEWGGFDCDFSVLPTRAQRRDFIREYVAAYFSRHPANGDAARVDEAAEAEKLMAEVDAFRGVPGFYWGIWSLIQSTISDIDFDYAGYAGTRLGEFWAWKGEESGSRKAKGQEMPLREKRWAQEE